MADITKLTFVNADKSWKFDGYCFVNMENSYGKRYSYKRKYWTYKGQNVVTIERKIFRIGQFDADGQAHEFKFIRELKVGEQEDSIVEETSNEETSNVVADEPVKVELPKNEWKPGEEIFHEKYSSILSCVDNNIPVFLVGPAGSGKNHTLEQVAKTLGLDFYFTNSVQQEYKLTGFIDAGGEYHETEFYKAFTNGGLFFLDEMDASIPEVLVLLNAAIANGYFEFPNGKATANDNFRVVAAGNTVGNGADEQYTGRMVIDQATLDRFAIIELGYSLNVEMAIAKGNTELVSFIRQLREEAESKGIRATFSYRCIAMVTKLENAMSLEEVMVIAVVKGLDKDTVNTLHPAGFSKYHKALENIQKVA